MLAAERVCPWVTTAGMVTPIGPSPISSAKCSTISPTTFATFFGVDFSGVAIWSRSAVSSPVAQVDRCTLDAAAADVDAEDGLVLGRRRRSWLEPSDLPPAWGEPVGAWHTGPMRPIRLVSATRIVPAPAEEIFDLLADPARHSRDRRVGHGPSGAGKPYAGAALAGRHLRHADALGCAVQDPQRGGRVRRGPADRLAALRRPHLALPARAGRPGLDPGDRGVRPAPLALSVGHPAARLGAPQPAGHRPDPGQPGGVGGGRSRSADGRSS